jgi:GNAT superfamily N-acetyltransferase
MVTIRRAQMKDAPAIARLVEALLTELSGEEVAPMGPVARQLLAGQQVIGLLAEADRRAVGVMMLNRCAAIYAGGGFGEISELYVEPAFRSRGVAADLLKYAREVARREDWTRLEVGAPAQPDWARTLAFYEREGFAQIGPRLRWVAE